MSDTEVGTPITHPEEMRASVSLRLGNNAALQATARATPAGMVTMGILASTVILSVAALVWAARRQPY
jgi:hypothetical protein